MNPLIYLYALAYWVVLMIIGISNGILRGVLFEHHMSELRAHQMSTLTGIILFLLTSSVFVFLVHLQVVIFDLVIVGILWVIMTILFEFLFGHYVMHHPWQRLLTDYNLREGRVWSFILITILISPSLFGFIMGVPL